MLFVAGPADASQWLREDDESQKGVLMAISASDGTELARYPLASPPIFDGMAAAGGRLYLSLENGHLVCMDEKGTGE